MEERIGTAALTGRCPTWKEHNDIMEAREAKASQRETRVETQQSFTIEQIEGDKMSNLVSYNHSASLRKEGRERRNNGTTKGAWGMPRLSEAKKDVTSCEKLRRVANTP